MSETIREFRILAWPAGRLPYVRRESTWESIVLKEYLEFVHLVRDTGGKVTMEERIDGGPWTTMREYANP